MPLSSRYLLRETGSNLRRNLVMTIAAIVTMVVSLAALGGVLIMREAINKQSVMWRGGVEMIAPTATGSGQLDAAQSGGTLIGKRYVDAAESIELLCTKAGAGSLSIGPEVLTIRNAKPPNIFFS